MEIIAAYNFYRDHIYAPVIAKLPYYRQYGISTEKLVAYTDWECFAAILLDDKGKGKFGRDLLLHEVKSCKIGNSFEFQYHRNSGCQKIDDDKDAHLIVVSYGDQFSRVEVRRIPNTVMAPVIEGWRKDVVTAYSNDNPKQRHRRSLTYGFAKSEGELIMLIENGRLHSREYCDFNV